MVKIIGIMRQFPHKVFILSKYHPSEMPLNPTHKLILHSLGHFYLSLNQPLSEKPVRARTSKIVFIELLRKSEIISKQERALYRNLKTLEKKRLIRYDHHLIQFTEKGLRELEKVQREIRPFQEMEHYFQKGIKSSRKLQTVMELGRKV